MITVLAIFVNAIAMLAAFYFGYKAGLKEEIKRESIDFEPLDLEEITEDENLKPIEEYMKEEDG